MTSRTTLYRARPRGIRPSLPSPTPQSWFQPTSVITDLLSPVNSHTVLGLPAFWRGVKLISGQCAQMTPAKVYAPDGITCIDTPTVVSRPLATMGAFDYWEIGRASWRERV